MTTHWFSNFVPFDDPMRVWGTEYVTPEHYYQAMKAENFVDRNKIAAAETPGKAKRLGNKVKLRENWDEQKLLFMKIALNYKFTKDTTHGKQLIKSIGSIVETNTWHDNYWGDCTCQKCENIIGQNMLGKLLMEIREELNRKD